MQVRCFIDASYGVHAASGKSHSGCAIIIGESGPVYAKSGKQKIVTKSSTEAELVALSDGVGQGILLRNFLVEQGYKMGPAVVYQDNIVEYGYSILGPVSKRTFVKWCFLEKEKDVPTHFYHPYSFLSLRRRDC